MNLSTKIALLEKAEAEGRLEGRDLDVIRIQVARAESKIIRATQASAFVGRSYAALTTAGD